MSSQTLQAHCACGAVQFELTGEPAVQAFCHCDSCRSWLGALVHAATLWPAANVRVVQGKDKLGLYKRTEASHRRFCTVCGGPVFVEHPALGMIDVPAGRIPSFPFQPALHVNYGEKVMSMRDGLPKFKDFPKEFGGSGETAAE